MSIDLNKKYWELLNKLDIVTIVAMAPRPGVDFIHSLFDSHPQVLTFDGWLFYNEFYQRSISLWGTQNFMLGYHGNVESKKMLNKVDARNFFYEFAWKHIHKFDSSYDILEGKNKLGNDRIESNEVDIDIFVNHAVHLIGSNSFNRKNTLLAIYGAYALARGEDLSLKKILIHQLHQAPYVFSFADDFPKVKIIACMRDPRVFGSQLETWKKHMSFSRSSIGVYYSVLKQLIDGVNPLLNLSNISIRVNVLERIHQSPEKILKNICNWLKIDFNQLLLKSTWNGKEWLGDSLSNDINETFNPKRYINSQNKWEKDLSLFDKIIIENLMRPQINHYGYVKKYNSIVWYIVLPIMIIIPAKSEISMLLSIMKYKKYSYCFFWVVKLFQRYILMYRKYFNILFRKEKLIDNF